ncbi:putative quinol monooxygenase [Kitasatospora sp. NPDC056181]|uniref:putative quinol monooxygenase n=1 Tax=Kitasatospora sp. NPDC056181 TaxID=3345737 RepID=UPI0035E05ACF
MEPHTVLLTAQIPLRSGREAALAEAFDRLRERSLQEPGVLSFERLAGATGTASTASTTGAVSTVVLREEYRDEATLDAHLAEPHTAEFLAVLPGLLAAAAAVRVDLVRTVRAFDVPPAAAG